MAASVLVDLDMSDSILHQVESRHGNFAGSLARSHRCLFLQALGMNVRWLRRWFRHQRSDSLR
jgi:hypothetical protein